MNKLNKPFDKTYKCDSSGRMSRYCYKKKTVEGLGLEYKEGRGYKIIVDNIGDLTEKAIIRDIFAYEKIGPRIYKLGKFTGYDCLEVEHIEGERYASFNPYTRENIKKLFKKYPFILPYEVDLGVAENYIGDKYIDFHGFQLNKPKFKEWLHKEINQRTHWGHLDDNDKKFSYQSCELVGKRDMGYRIKQMKLDKINFRNKKVLDVGCNLGMFMHYITDKGGSCIGYDTPPIMNIASIYRFWTKPYADIEFRLPSDEEFDIQLHLAMVHTFGYPEAIAPLTIFEGHNLQDEDKVEQELKKNFTKVQFINYTKDRGIRPVFWCWR